MPLVINTPGWIKVGACKLRLMIADHHMEWPGNSMSNGLAWHGWNVSKWMVLYSHLVLTQAVPVMGL